MNTQELFDMSVRGVLRQGVQSLNHSSECSYRACGLCCAVGFIIKDEFYHPSLESLNIADYEVIEALENSIGRELTSDETSMFRALQSAHDSNHYNYPELTFKERFFSEAKEIANEYGLLFNIDQNGDTTT